LLQAPRGGDDRQAVRRRQLRSSAADDQRVRFAVLVDLCGVTRR
jgi:hypothetical protein